MKKLVIARRCSQVFFLGLFVYILWSTTYPLQGRFSPQVLFKIDPLIMIFTALAERRVIAGILFSLGMLALTLVLGRFFCGWMCPLGTLVDGTGFLARKIKKKPLSDLWNGRLRKAKFVLLAAVFVFALFGVQVAWVMDPVVLAARVVSMNLIPTVTLGIDRMFSGLIREFELYGPVYDLYRQLKTTFLGINGHFRFLSCCPGVDLPPFKGLVPYPLPSGRVVCVGRPFLSA
jgi:polyferredoxin